MRFISCDQSYANFALIAWEDDKPIARLVIHSGSDTEQNLSKQYGFFSKHEQLQLDYIYKQVNAFVLKFNPEAIIFEGLSFGSTGNMVFGLGGLYYHVTTSLVTDGLISPDKIYKVSPISAKKHGRACLDEEDAFEKTKDGVVIVKKDGSPKPNTMPKKFMLKALQNTEHGWITEGYSTSSKIKETGAHDLPDAYFIGKAFLAGDFVKTKVKKAKKVNGKKKS